MLNLFTKKALLQLVHSFLQSNLHTRTQKDKTIRLITFLFETKIALAPPSLSLLFYAPK